ncbi:MAG: HigA family addiction module antidote protein [Polyangiaceae bacterium]|nr:HigA family addiction module antidote protein [Polyangiaceae bacterium]
MLPKNRAPTHPGVILEEEFLKPLGMSQVALAAEMGVPVQRVNTIISGKRGVTAETALLLARVFNNTPQFWMSLQTSVDLWEAQRGLEKRKVS